MRENEGGVDGGEDVSMRANLLYNAIQQHFKFWSLFCIFHGRRK